MSTGYNLVMMMKREQIEVILALLGFVCACISSCLIISISLPGAEFYDRDLLDNPPVTRQLELYTMPSHLRAHRRLLEDRASAAKETTRQLLTPVYTTEAPSASPTMISNSHLPEAPTDRDDGYFTTADTVPLVLAGTASTLIICALFLYGKDTYERRIANPSPSAGVQEKVEDPETEEITTGAAGSFNSTAGISSSSNSRALVPYTRDTSNKDYPSMLDGISPTIDQMSTMTESIYTHTYASQAWGVGDLAAQANDTASCSKATTLSDDYRVDASTALMSLVKPPSSPSPPPSTTTNSSPCSSLTSGSSRGDGGSHSRSSSQSSSLVGEDCLVDDEFYSPLGSLAPLEYTPDKKKKTTMEVEERDDTTSSNRRSGEEDEEEDELERMINAVAASAEDDLSAAPVTEESVRSNTAVVRSIYFAPSKEATALATRVSIGLELSGGDDGTLYPSVTKIDPKSPLLGRVFVGDVVTEIDDADTAGLTAEETLALLELMDGRSMVKLTVCSNESDGDSSNGKASTTSDYGMAETTEEV